jgi:AcrR family transcriptional regulator
VAPWDFGSYNRSAGSGKSLYGTEVPFVNVTQDLKGTVVESPSAPGATQETAERQQRADARRNQAQILEAAEVLFAEQGMGIPIDDIAKKAGVGVGTVYRHFPTKEALAGAIVVTRMEQLATEAETLESSEDAGTAFLSFLARLGDEALAKRDLVEALMGAGFDFKELSSEVKPRLERSAEVLLKKAQAAGAVRCDVEVADLFALVLGTCEAASRETRCSRARMMSVVIDGLRTSPNEDPVLSA